MCTGPGAFYETKLSKLEVVRKTYEVYREQVEQGFENAGWCIDSGFSDYLVIGSDGDDLSILVHEEALETDVDTVFELIDHERYLSYGVQEIPTPSRPRICSKSTVIHIRNLRPTSEATAPGWEPHVTYCLCRPDRNSP
jgi:hypothetical protein